MRRGVFARKGSLVAVGLASALLVAFVAGPASAQQHPPIDVQFVSAKLVAGGAAVCLTLSVRCDALPNDNNSDPQSFSLNGQLSEAISRTILTQGSFNYSQDPTQLQDQNDPNSQFCNGDPDPDTGSPGDLRVISFYVQPGGGCCGGGSTAPFKAGSAFLGVGANSCNYRCFNDQGQFTGPSGNGQMAEGGGFQGAVKITRR